MDADSTVTTTPPRSDALARAAALATRAKELRRAQVEVQDLTAREVQVLARTAASFFDAIPLPEFTSSLLPPSAKHLRRMRHRILHRTVHTTMTGTMIHAMLLGRDGVLRLFSARTADSRDLLLSLEPGRALPATVIRDVVEWEPTLRVAGFRPFEILDKLSGSLDAVEAQLSDAEAKVEVQKQALASGDLTALLPGRAPQRALPSAMTDSVEYFATSEREASRGNDATDEATPARGRTRSMTPALVVTLPPDTASPVVIPNAQTLAGMHPFDIFEVVEAVAAGAPSRMETPESSPVVPDDASLSSRYAPDDEPEEWDEPEEPTPPPYTPMRTSLFPVLPPPH